MPNYRLRYVCETSLRFERDVALGTGPTEVLFLFSQKKETEQLVNVHVTVEAANYQTADAQAQPVLLPALDALSFSTGTPLLIQYWKLHRQR